MARSAISVEVMRIGTSAKKVALPRGATVSAALEAAKLSLKDTEVVQVNEDVIDNDEVKTYEVENGDEIILVKNVAGGRE